MARHKVEIANVNTANIKVLTNEEMIVLFKKYKEGDLFAKEELINGNLKLVLSILRKYNNRTDNMDDLFQVGCIGLIKAIDNFDLSHEVKFSTYAVPMILGEVKRFLRDNNSVRISRSIKDSISMFEPIYNDGGDTIYLADQLEDKCNDNRNFDLRVALNDAIKALSSKERKIINERYLYGKTQMELADELGISQAQISRLEKSGLQNIKKMIS